MFFKTKSFILVLLISFSAHAAQWNSLYPDRNLSPGAVDPKATKEKVCTPGYTSTVRDSSIKTRKEVFKRYGLKWEYKKFYEVDHFIPLSLGGSNALENLWPERYCPLPHKSRCLGAREKDVVEHYLLRQICAGRITLKTAQDLITGDWIEIFNSL